MSLITKLKLGAAILAAALLAGLVFYAQSLAQERDRLSAEASALAAANQKLSRSLAAQYEALAQREAEATALKAETSRQREELLKIYAENEDAKAWAGVCLPGPVYELLRRGGALPAE